MVRITIWVHPVELNSLPNNVGAFLEHASEGKGSKHTKSDPNVLRKRIVRVSSIVYSADGYASTFGELRWFRGIA